MSDRSTAVGRLNVLVGDIVDLRHATSLIGWDERVSMPPGGVEVHGVMAATVQRIAHEKFTSAHHQAWIVPDTDASGILQDMHWSIGLFGYLAYLESKYGQLYGMSPAVRA